jgi:hypothetical protein
MVFLVILVVVLCTSVTGQDWGAQFRSIPSAARAIENVRKIKK